LAGLAAGVLLGGIAWGLLKGPARTSLPLGLICVGLVLGFPAVGIIAVGVALGEWPQWLPERVSPGARIPSGMSLGIFTLGWILWARLVCF
jgi:hypothetical protein